MIFGSRIWTDLRKELSQAEATASSKVLRQAHVGTDAKMGIDNRAEGRVGVHDVGKAASGQMK